MTKIETKDSRGNTTGWLIPIWNVTDGLPVDQIYLTVISQGSMKGPHLHMKRRGMFKVLRGVVLVVWRTPNTTPSSGPKYYQERLSITSDLLIIPPGIPAALYNRGVGEAYVLNMPSPAWKVDDTDDHEVELWNPKL